MSKNYKKTQLHALVGEERVDAFGALHGEGVAPLFDRKRILVEPNLNEGKAEQTWHRQKSEVCEGCGVGARRQATHLDKRHNSGVALLNGLLQLSKAPADGYAYTGRTGSRMWAHGTVWRLGADAEHPARVRPRWGSTQRGAGEPWMVIWQGWI